MSGPISVRLAQFAQRFYAARCRCVIDGDSINSDEAQPRMIGGYIRKLRPPRGMSGYCGLGASAGNQAAFVNNRPTGTSGGGLHGFGSTSPGTDTSTAGESKVHTTVFDDSGLWPGDKTHFDLFYDAKFLKTTAGAPPGAYTIGRSDFPGGDFLTGADSTCRLSLYSGSAGIRQATFTASRDGGSSNATFMDNVTLAAGYNTIDIPLTADPRDVQIQILAGAGENETNKNIYLLMLRWFASSGTGLELSFAAKGSSNVTQRADTANRVTQAARNNHVSVCDVDTVILWNDENSSSIDATWYANLLTLIDSWRTGITGAGRTPRFLLVTSYQTTSSNAAKVAATADYHRLAASTYSDVSCYCLGVEDNGFALAQGVSYLGDLVHPTTTGADYLASLLNLRLLQSLYNAPTPLRTFGGGIDRRSLMLARRTA